jgi:general L-amino acid transport system permease protein
MAYQDVSGRGAARPPRPAFYNDPLVRAIFYQVALIAAVVALGWYLVNNTLDNMARQGIAGGFDFLHREAAFEISEKLVEYSPSDTYGRAFLVGILNTLQVAIAGILFATIWGTILGIARLSSNWLIRKLALCYVELFRNIPLPLQLLFWWAFFREMVPGPRQAWHLLPGVFLSNRGLVFPVPKADPAQLWIAIAFVAGIVGAIVLHRWAKRRQSATGEQFPSLLVGAGLIVGLPVAVFLAAGAPSTLDIPKLRGFNFGGGYAITPEFTALLVGLVVYTASFIAEIVRGGIQAVSWGQSEAAAALGLSRSHALRLVVLPQALRVIVPPMTSQYLNITKNSSLAIIIGYPDVVAIANTIMNQTGQAVEGISLIMAIYLTISLSIALFMNWYNRAVALVER